MTSNLILGTLVLSLGLGVSVVQLVHIARERRAHLGNDSTLREHMLSLVFLGAVPMLAGMLFIGAWMAVDEPGVSTAIAAGNYAPAR